MNTINETPEWVNETDELLAKAVARGESLRMPKPKPSWQHRAKKRLQASRKNKEYGATPAYRVAYRNSLRGQWVKLQQECKRRGQEWLLDYGDWVVMWLQARPASLGVQSIPAWKHRGRKKDNVQLFRVEKDKAWCLENVEIWQGKNRLWP